MFNALEMRRKQYREFECKRFVETESGRWWSYSASAQNAYTKVDSLLRSSLINHSNHSYPSRDEHPIGSHYFTNALSTDAYYELNPDLRNQITSIEQQLTNFFAAECTRWSPKSYQK